MTSWFQKIELWDLFDPLTMFFNPAKRVFCLYMLGGLILMLLFTKTSLRSFFSSTIWFNHSSRGDVKLIVVNSILRLFLVPSTAVGLALVAAIISRLLKIVFGDMAYNLMPLGVGIGLFTFTFFIVDDLFRFFLHRWQHTSPFLWKFHEVHHNATSLTPLSLYRTHPVELLMARVRDILSYGIVTGIFFFFFGSKLEVWEIMGVNLLGFLFNILGANLRHSHVWLTFGVLEKLFVSPAAHQIHHGRDKAYHDKNFGSFFAVWDLLNNSHVDPRTLPPVTEFGVDDDLSEEERNSLLNLYFGWRKRPKPFVDRHNCLIGL